MTPADRLALLGLTRHTCPRCLRELVTPAGEPMPGHVNLGLAPCQEATP